MQLGTRRRTAATAAAVAALIAGALGVAPAARAATSVITAVAITYQPAELTISEGDSLQLVNLDGPIPHDVVSDDALFASATINAAGSPAPVVGVEALPPGAYAFHCTVHPTQMRGTLTVTPGAGGGGIEPPDLPRGVVTLGHLVPTPTAITLHDGGAYIASYGLGTIFRAPILDGGLLGPAEAYATGFTNPLGVAVAPDGTVFVADSHPSATTGRVTAGRVTAIPAGGGALADVGEPVVDELPNGRHNTNNLTVHGGRLYITNGNSTDDGVDGGSGVFEAPLSGTLLSVDLAARGIVVDGTDPAPPEGLTLEASGMRNLYDAVFRPGTDEAWITMNGPDMQDPYGEDLLLVADVADADVEDFGFPGCLYAAPSGTPPQQNANPAVADGCDGTEVPPAALMGLHTSADGAAFSPTGDALYVARFGNFFGTRPVGHDIARVPIAPDGTAGAPASFLPGITPLDVAMGDAGLYVADFTGLVLLVPSALL